jgi:glutathionylspermidine synthase
MEGFIGSARQIKLKNIVQQQRTSSNKQDTFYVVCDVVVSDEARGLRWVE